MKNRRAPRSGARRIHRGFKSIKYLIVKGFPQVIFRRTRGEGRDEKSRSHEFKGVDLCSVDWPLALSFFGHADARVSDDPTEESYSISRSR
jgi:hypothetical protein